MTGVQKTSTRATKTGATETGAKLKPALKLRDSSRVDLKNQ